MIEKESEGGLGGVEGVGGGGDPTMARFLHYYTRLVGSGFISSQAYLKVHHHKTLLHWQNNQNTKRNYGFPAHYNHNHQ